MVLCRFQNDISGTMIDPKSYVHDMNILPNVTIEKEQS